MKWHPGTLIVVGSLSLGGAAAVATSGPAAAKTKPHHKAKAKHKKLPPGVGASFKVLNEAKQYEVVKLVEVIDPAAGADQFTTPDAGKRFVGVEVSITNKSAGVDASDANSNLAVVGSDKQDYTPDFNSISECTNFDNGSYHLAKGQTEVGCVTFQIPTGISVAKVQYNPNGGFSTNNAQWTLTPPG